LLTLDAASKLEHFDPALEGVAQVAGVTLELGAEVTPEGQRALAAELAECLLNLIERRPLEPLTLKLLAGEPLELSDRPNGASFSGGGATYVYGGPAESARDLGPALGRAIHQRLN